MATSTSSDSRRRLAEAIARHQAGQSSGGSRIRTAAIVATVVTLLAALALWAFGVFGRGTPPEIRELRSIVDAQVKEYDKVARNEAPLSYEFASFGPVFDTMRKLPDGMRDQAREEMERLFRARERAEMKSYFALPAAARAAELDRRIKAQEDQRKARMAEWEKRNAERNADRNNDRNNQRGSATAGQGRGPDGPGGPPGGRGGPGGGNRGPGGPGGGPGGPGGGPPGGRGTEEGRNTRSKQRIDSTSPTERSQQAEYRRAMDVRRQEMGLPTGGRRP